MALFTINILMVLLNIICMISNGGTNPGLMFLNFGAGLLCTFAAISCLKNS